MTIQYRLTPDQEVGRDFLADRSKALLADEVGFGKTVQALAAISTVGIKPVLWVTSAQAAYQVADEDAANFAQYHTARVVRGTKRQRQIMWSDRADISVVGYETFRNDVKILCRIPWKLVVLDDVNKMKNPESQLSIAANKVCKAAERAWAMTATPIEIALTDLWSVFHAINYYPLGTWPTFNARYCIWGWKRHANGRSTKSIIRYENLPELQKKLRGNVLRRTGASGPEIILMTHYLGIYPEQSALYRLARSGHFGYTVYDRFQRCLQFVDSTRFTDTRPYRSSKIDLVMQILEQYHDKVVIYSQWKKTLYHLMERLSAARIPYVEMTGDIPIPLRAGRQQRFRHEPGLRVCIVSKTGEGALNLEAAKLMICINRIANPARMYQVHGRIKRHTSKSKRVYILDLVARGTVEERMLALSERRRQLPRDVFGDDLPIRITTEDMQNLLREDAAFSPEETGEIHL